MRRRRLLLLVAVVLAVGLLVAVLVLTPTPPIPEQRPAPTVAQRPKPALQSDAEGYYVPGYRFTVGRFRFTGFSLRPEALVTFAQTAAGIEDAVACFETLIRADTFHLRCDFPQVGIVSIDGRFLTRVATTSLDRAVVSAVVTIRDATGEILYSARDSFTWHPPAD